MPYQIRNSGFTLIELSIVLVIIGLIVGGVLTGRDLIRAAEVRQTVSQLERFNTATHTFRLKFNCLPGDCANATTFGLTDQMGGTGAANGNGDGAILGVSSLDPLDPAGWENRNYWGDLVQTGLIADHAEFPIDTANNLAGLPGSDSPTAPIAKQIAINYLGPHHVGGWWLFYEALGNASSPADLQFPGHVFILSICAEWGCGGGPGSDVVTPRDAYAMDAKIDDGLPQTGMVRAMSQNVGAAGRGGGGLYDASTGAAGTANCINNGVTPNLYNVINTSFLCDLAIQAQF